MLLLGLLLLLSYLVVRGFLVPLLWAAVFSYVTWPANAALGRWLGDRRSLAALVMTLFLGMAILLPLAGIAVSLRQELGETLDSVRGMLEGGALAIPEWLSGIPVVGQRMARLLSRVAENPSAAVEWLGARSGGISEGAASALGVVGRNLFKLAFTLVAAFFFYRDGERWVRELRFGFFYLLGERSSDYWSAAAAVTRGVVYGLVLTALAQGAVAALGYWVAGVAAPILLGALTATLALIPFGAAVVWVPIALWLLMEGNVVAGVGLLLWGVFAISLVDNFIRPYVISASANISFLTVLIGVLGGVKAFGLVGLFVGPAVLAVLWSVWSQWRQQASEASRPSERAEGR